MFHNCWQTRKHCFLLIRLPQVLNCNIQVFYEKTYLPCIVTYSRNWGCNYPLRGGKYTLWEGGVRGVAFVHSPLLVDAKRVSNDIMHVTDWLPTLYHAAGGDLDDIKIKLDGYNMWNMISLSKRSPRKEVLHNIDPVTKTAAIRMGKYKLIVNQNMNYYSSWYQV